MTLNFDWTLFGAVTVNDRDDGFYYLIDGQRRANAAEILGIKEIPANVFIGMQLDEEARAFVGINDKRTSVSTVENFLSKIVAKDPAALELKGVLNTVGWEVDKTGNPMTLRCVSRVERMYKYFGEDALQNTLNFVAEHHEGDIHVTILDAMCRLEFFLNKKGLSVHQFPNKGINSRAQCLKKCADVKALYSDGGRTAPVKCSRALLSLINKGKSTRKIRIDFSGERDRPEGE